MSLKNVKIYTGDAVRSLQKARKKRLGPPVVAALTLMGSSAAWADAQDAFNFVAGAAVRYEDNLFRLDNHTDARALLGRSKMSDLIYSVDVGIKIDKPYAQQRFQLDFLTTRNQHQTYDFLDFNAVDYRAAWMYHVTPHISGELSTSQHQSVTSFSDFRGTNLSTPALNRRNVQTNESRIFNIDGDIGAGIHLLGGVTETRSRSSQTFNAVADYVQDGVELGVKYVAPSENYVSLVRREAQGDYRGRTLDVASQLDTGFDQSETELKFLWRVTGKSEFNGRLDYLERDHDHFSRRDFSGLTGNVTYRWIPTGKLVLDVTVARNLYSFQELTNSFYDANSITIAPKWLVTAKTQIGLKGSISDRDFHGALIPVADMRHDIVRTLMLTADWAPTRTITVNGTLAHEERSSNIQGLDYDANTVGVSAQLVF